MICYSLFKQFHFFYVLIFNVIIASVWNCKRKRDLCSGLLFAVLIPDPLTHFAALKSNSVLRLQLIILGISLIEICINIQLRIVM